ncbi:MAG: pyridoxal-dependent decarboxylase, partial [Proteobacteria bacterium]|nr:pyridoxal-dependent decarboxylase [Pseudomonadota bacterium]
LTMNGQALADLASQFGTPLHVVSAETIRARTQELKNAFAAYPGGVSLHFSYKTNSVAGILGLLHGEGIGAEVVDGYELYLARRLGVANEAIVFNGPNKSDEELTLMAEL